MILDYYWELEITKYLESVLVVVILERFRRIEFGVEMMLRTYEYIINPLEVCKLLSTEALAQI